MRVAVKLCACGGSPGLAQLQREALRNLRTSTRPMYLVTSLSFEQFDDQAAQDLGKAWNKLEQLAQELGVEPLSSFIALPDEDAGAGVPADQLIQPVVALIGAVQEPERKFPSKRATVAALTQIRDTVMRLVWPPTRICLVSAGVKMHFLPAPYSSKDSL